MHAMWLCLQTNRSGCLCIFTCWPKNSFRFFKKFFHKMHLFFANVMKLAYLLHALDTLQTKRHANVAIFKLQGAVTPHSLQNFRALWLLLVHTVTLQVDISVCLEIYWKTCGQPPAICYLCLTIYTVLVYFYSTSSVGGLISTGL